MGLHMTDKAREDCLRRRLRALGCGFRKLRGRNRAETLYRMVTFKTGLAMESIPRTLKDAEKWTTDFEAIKSRDDNKTAAVQRVRNFIVAAQGFLKSLPDPGKLKLTPDQRRRLLRATIKGEQALERLQDVISTEAERTQ